MRKLLTIALFIVSPTLFAKNFNPDLLVGKWQCKGAITSPYIVGTETYVETYKSNGTVESKNVINETMEGQKAIVTMHTLGKWKLEGDILSGNVERVLAYHNSNKLLEEQGEFGKFLQEDKSFLNYKLLELSKNKYVVKQTPKDEKYGTKFKYTCHRIR